MNLNPHTPGACWLVLLWCEFKGDSTKPRIHFILSLTPQGQRELRARTSRVTWCSNSSAFFTFSSSEGRGHLWHSQGQHVQAASQKWPRSVLTTSEEVALLPTERRRELRQRPWRTFPQMTQVLKAVGLESGLMSDPKPALLSPCILTQAWERTWIFLLGPKDRMMPSMCEIQGKASLPASAGTL